jgi:Tfp pilus assembly protein PilF
VGLSQEMDAIVPLKKRYCVFYSLLGVTLGVVLVFGGCVRKGRPKPSYARPPVVETPKAGPERNASNHLIIEGQQYLKLGMYGQAAYNFQEAINVDPNNGAAFYYLAYTKYRGGEYERVPILLDRAASLLKGKEWDEKIEKLENSVREAQK